MILSMTGYGRAQQQLNGRNITVEIKSVNSRYFEYASRLPRGYSFLDDKLKRLLNSSISRGKVELGLVVVDVDSNDTLVSVNEPLAKAYCSALQEMAQNLSVPNDVTTAVLSRFPDVFAVTKASLNEEQVWADVESVAKQAVQAFVAMRAIEGEKMKEDILSRLATIENSVGKLETLSEGRVQKYTDKLYAKLQDLLADRNIDDSRILTEAAIFADKTAVDEETVRLRSHIKQYREILSLDEPVGRKLDFLTQELNRETNTIGSKAQELEMTRIVVDTKAELEKIREQIQNLE